MTNAVFAACILRCESPSKKQMRCGQSRGAIARPHIGTSDQSCSAWESSVQNSLAASDRTFHDNSGKAF